MNLDAIEPLKPLGITLVKVSDDKVEFHLPINGNRNDKGTVFAGSQYSALVICGWYLASHWAEHNGLQPQVAVKDSHVNYPKSAQTDLEVCARFEAMPDLRPSGHWRALIIVEAKDINGDIVSQHKADYRILTA